MNAERERKIGVAYGVGAFLWWGGAVFYFKAVAHVAPMEVLAHRIVWSVAMLALLLALGGRLGGLRAAFGNPRTLAALSATTVLIAVNWYVFIRAVGHSQVLQTSLGYFINPLVIVLLGCLFLHERLTRAQLVSVLLAGAGVVILTVENGALPVPGLLLALTFGFYGLLRKVVPVDGVTGLAAETILLLPAAAAYLFRLARRGDLAFAHAGRGTDVLLLLAGVITAVPLIWHVNATRRLRYATIGLMLYITPSLTFLFAVFLFHEPFNPVKLSAFLFIWIALAVYSVSAIRGSGKKKGTGTAAAR